MQIVDSIIGSEAGKIIFGAIIAFILGILATVLTQIWQERRQKSRITYERTIENTLSIAKEELRDKLSILYDQKDVKNLYFCNLRIANTGKGIIKNQAFTCLFDEEAHSIDPLFPRISTIPSREVGPIIIDTNNSRSNEWRYTIETLGQGQVVSIDFLTVDNHSSKFEVIFRSNSDKEVNFVEGSVSQTPNIEYHFYNVTLGIFTVFVAGVIGDFIPVFGGLFAALFSFPNVFLAFRSLRPMVNYLANNFQKKPIIQYQLSGSFETALIGDNGTIVREKPITDTLP